MSDSEINLIVLFYDPIFGSTFLKIQFQILLADSVMSLQTELNSKSSAKFAELNGLFFICKTVFAFSSTC